MIFHTDFRARLENVDINRKMNGIRLYTGDSECSDRASFGDKDQKTDSG